MTNLFLVPNWFFGFDILMEFLFAIITLWVSYFSHSLYKLTDKRQFRLFSLGFIFISFSYIIQIIFNILILFKFNENICETIKFISVSSLNSFGFSLFMISFILGLVTLCYTLLKIKNVSVFILLSVLALSNIFFSVNYYYFSFIISSLLLGFIVFLYLQQYFKKRNNNLLLVLVAFLFLFLSKVHFIFSMNHSLAYAIGHFLELTAYVFILLSFYTTLRR